MAKKITTPTGEKSDFGTPELKQHHKIVVEQLTDNMQRARNLSQMPIDTYLARGFITFPEWQAGNRIYQDFIYAGRIQLTVSDFSKLPYRSKPPHDFSDGQIAARKRFYRALDQLEQEGQYIVQKVCCFGEWTSDQPGFPRKYALARLRSALHELAVYFGYVSGSAREGGR